MCENSEATVIYKCQFRSSKRYTRIWSLLLINDLINKALKKVWWAKQTISRLSNKLLQNLLFDLHRSVECLFSERICVAPNSNIVYHNNFYTRSSSKVVHMETGTWPKAWLLRLEKLDLAQTVEYLSNRVISQLADNFLCEWPNIFVCFFFIRNEGYFHSASENNYNHKNQYRNYLNTETFSFY